MGNAGVFVLLLLLTSFEIQSRCGLLDILLQNSTSSPNRAPLVDTVKNKLGPFLQDLWQNLTAKFEPEEAMVNSISSPHTPQTSRTDADPHATDYQRSEATEKDSTTSVAEKQTSSKIRTSTSTAARAMTTTTLKKRSTKSPPSRATDSVTTPTESDREKGITITKKAAESVTERTTRSAAGEVPSEFATEQDVTTAGEKTESNAAARTGTPEAAEVPSHSPREESGTTIEKSEESIGPATTESSSATEDRTETGELRATAASTDRKSSNGETTTTNVDTKTPAASQHNSTAVDATVNSADSNATAHTKPSTPQVSESFSAGVSATSSDLMNSEAITKEGTTAVPSGTTTAHVDTDPAGEGHSSASATGSNHSHSLTERTESTTGTESSTVHDEKSSTSIYSTTRTAAGYHVSTGSTQRTLHTQSNTTGEPNFGGYSEETSTVRDLLMQNGTEESQSQEACTSFVTQNVSLTEVSSSQENSSDPTLEGDSTQASDFSGETLFSDRSSTTLQTEIDGAYGTATFSASTARSGQTPESATESSSGQNITGVTEQSDYNGQRSTTKELGIQEAASTRLDEKWSQSSTEGGAQNSSEASQVHHGSTTVSPDPSRINNTDGSLTQAYQPGDDATTAGPQGMESNVTSNAAEGDVETNVTSSTTEDVILTTTQGLEMETTGESSTQKSVNTSGSSGGAHEDAAESDDMIKVINETTFHSPSGVLMTSQLILYPNGTMTYRNVTGPSCPPLQVNTSNSLSPLPNATELSGLQPIGTRIIHMCAVSYVFASTQQPLKVYECMPGGNWTSNFNGEACEYVAPRLKNMHDL